MDDVFLGSPVRDRRYPNQDTLTIITSVEGKEYTKRIEQKIRISKPLHTVALVKAAISRLLSISFEDVKSNITRLLQGCIYELH